jgi:hypothetical protein
MLIGSFWPAHDTNWGLFLDEVNGSYRFHLFHGRNSAGGVVNTNHYSNTFSLSASTWNSFAFTYDGSSHLRFFINGTMVGDINQTIGFGDSGTSIPMSTGSAYDGSYKFLGMIDEIRITKGKARYTSNYTPSTIPFPNP